MKKEEVTDVTSEQAADAAKEKPKSDAKAPPKPNGKNQLPFEDLLAAKPSTSKPPVIVVPEKRNEDLHDFVIDIEVPDSLMRNGEFIVLWEI